MLCPIDFVIVSKISLWWRAHCSHKFQRPTKSPAKTLLTNAILSYKWNTNTCRSHSFWTIYSRSLNAYFIQIGRFCPLSKYIQIFMVKYIPYDLSVKSFWFYKFSCGKSEVISANISKNETKTWPFFCVCHILNDFIKWSCIILELNFTHDQKAYVICSDIKLEPAFNFRFIRYIVSCSQFWNSGKLNNIRKCISYFKFFLFSNCFANDKKSCAKNIQTL